MIVDFDGMGDSARKVIRTSTLVEKIRLGLLIAFILFVAGWGYHMWNKPEVIVGQAIEAPPNEVVKGKAIEEFTPKKPVKAVAGGAKLKTKLHLPAPVIADDDEKIMGSVDIPADGERRRITPTLKGDTGEGKIYVEVLPSKWFDYMTSGNIQTYVGYGAMGETVRLEGNQDIFSIKRMKFGVKASVDQPLSNVNNSGIVTNPYWFVGGGARLEW